MNSSPETAKVTIIGGGPAGYTAAIYAARAGLEPILYEGPEPGGQLTTTTDVENYPGYPKGVLGPQMMQDFKTQAERFGAKVHCGTVTALDPQFPPHKITIENTKKILTHTVIIATGASAKWLGLLSEQRLKGRGVSSCAVCDGFFFKGEDVAVVGGGDSAAEEAIYLAKLCRRVYMIVRRDKMRASHIMQERVLSTSNIEVLWHHEVEEVLGTQQVEAVRLLNNQKDRTITIDVKALFIAIGHRPNTDIFQHLTKDPRGYISVKSPTTHTNVPGIFVAGDVSDPIYRQAITAAGSGCRAALDAERYLGKLSL